MRLRDILNKVPFKILVPFVFLIYYLSILLYVVFLPLAYVYGRILCTQVWIEWEKQGKDVLVVYTGAQHSEQWMSRIRELVGTRAVFLNYDDRDRWDRWSLPAQLFHIFGPHAIPDRFTADNLPAVIVFRRIKSPAKFVFGKRTKEAEARLEQLRTELAPAAAIV
jgi:hypothetical protein